MKKYILLIFSILITSCTAKFEQVKLVVKLPKKLKEVSGITTVKGSNLLWMHNDSGNKNELYGVTSGGEIERIVKVKAKNHDWEDATSDADGNLYIGDFGNNDNTRRNLVILKINNQDLQAENTVEVEKIKFSYPDQHKFPPKKKQLFFDAESFFFSNGNFYVFTKSRVKKYYGKTRLYKIPAKKGNHVAEFISEFNTSNDLSCWTTSADISPDGKKIALLNLNRVLVFSDFQSDDFLKGKLTEYDLGFTSQKEGITFKGNSTLLITDEKANGKGGKLYQLNLN